MLRRLPVHPAAHGFVPGRSVATNAQVHLQAGAKVLVHFDIKDFFPSITQEMVVAALLRAGLPYDQASHIAYICTLEGRLPQGAPTSPYLANIVAYRMDVRLAALAEQWAEATYTRYADDLTFGFAWDVDRDTIYRLRKTVERILKEEGFRLHRGKTRVARPHRRRTVTGVVLTPERSTMNIPREVRLRIRAMLHHLETGKQDTDPQELLGLVSWWHSVNPGKAKPYLERTLALIRRSGAEGCTAPQRRYNSN